ncbi:hypothetical protein WN982_08640 [Paraburkholderia sp. IMGN_8]|uniref:hypothetical protein n=1 Tax=Paraburkholderia sp. IMGN_8 TaxID=3136564 RepID=UPI003101383F
MSYAMWGIDIAMAIMLVASLQRYRKMRQHERELRWLDQHHVSGKLRKRYGWSVQK